MSQSPRIAVADAQPEMRDFLQQAVRSMGHQTCGVAKTVSELEELYRAEQPDLTIAGVNLPGWLESGDKEILSAAVPLILLVESHDGKLAGNMAAGNVLACLVKPILQVDLIPVVALAMHRFRQLQSLRKETEELRRMVSEPEGAATDSQPRRAE